MHKELYISMQLLIHVVGAAACTFIVVNRDPLFRSSNLIKYSKRICNCSEPPPHCIRKNAILKEKSEDIAFLLMWEAVPISTFLRNSSLFCEQAPDRELFRRNF
jgi:hypothetical protein